LWLLFVLVDTHKVSELVLLNEVDPQCVEATLRIRSKCIGTAGDEFAFVPGSDLESFVGSALFWFVPEIALVRNTGFSFVS
jgi:hypothetical protein